MPKVLAGVKAVIVQITVLPIEISGWSPEKYEKLYY